MAHVAGPDAAQKRVTRAYELLRDGTLVPRSCAAAVRRLPLALFSLLDGPLGNLPTFDPGPDMVKSEFIRRIAAQNPHLYQRDIESIVDAIIDEIAKALGRGDRVELRGFGAFSAKIRGARKGRNPKTGVEVQVEQKVMPSFKTGKEMRARLNRETAQPAESKGSEGELSPR